MTRENKLALIIGFGLLLFVGILVSDHLSARTGPAVVPIALRTKEQVSLPRELEVPREFGQANQPLPPTNPEFEDTRIVRVQPPLVGPQDAVVVQPPQQFNIQEPQERVHVIAKGESLGVVSKKYYNTTRYAAQLEALNGVKSSALKIGQQIKIPPIEVIDPSKAVIAVQPMDQAGSYAFPVDPQVMQDAGAVAQFRTVTLAKGQTLYQLAARELGSGPRWNEITQANGDPIGNPNSLRVGASLRIPNN